MGLTHSGSQWIFRFRPHDGMGAKVIAKFIVDELKQKKVAIVHASDASGNGGRDMLTPAVKDLGGEVVLHPGLQQRREGFHRSGPGSQEVGRHRPRHLHDVRHGSRRVRPADQATRRPDDVGGGPPSITGVHSRNLAGDSLYGTYGLTDFHVEASPTSKAFATDYKAKYGQEPDLYAAWWYDAVLVFAEGMKKAPALKPENIRKRIRASRSSREPKASSTSVRTVTAWITTTSCKTTRTASRCSRRCTSPARMRLLTHIDHRRTKRNGEGSHE